MADPLPLTVHHPDHAARHLVPLVITADTSVDEAMAAIKPLATFNGSTLGLVRFEGRTPWEIHDDDEFLLIVDGDIHLEILNPDGGELRGVASTGQVVVVPAKHWHRQDAPTGGTVMFITGPNGDVSKQEDPRRA